jgi:S-adenosylmethionine:tRNA ribosyltransferase-isomerase
MDVCEFDFDLPSDLIAQDPAADRAGARLLCLDRQHGVITHDEVATLPDLLTPGDVIVVNDTRVFPARLIGRRVPTGGAVECLLLERVRARGEAEGLDARSDQWWEALVHPGQK